jgi:hypothetical protein
MPKPTKKTYNNINYIQFIIQPDGNYGRINKKGEILLHLNMLYPNIINRYNETNFFFSSRYKFTIEDIKDVLTQGKKIIKSKITNDDIAQFFINKNLQNLYINYKLNRVGSQSANYDVTKHNIKFMLELFFADKSSPYFFYKNIKYRINNYDIFVSTNKHKSSTKIYNDDISVGINISSSNPIQKKFYEDNFLNKRDPGDFLKDKKHTLVMGVSLALSDSDATLYQKEKSKCGHIYHKFISDINELFNINAKVFKDISVFAQEPMKIVPSITDNTLPSNVRKMRQLNNIQQIRSNPMYSNLNMMNPQNINSMTRRTNNSIDRVSLENNIILYLDRKNTTGQRSLNRLFYYLEHNTGFNNINKPQLLAPYTIEILLMLNTILENNNKYKLNNDFSKLIWIVKNLNIYIQNLQNNYIDTAYNESDKFDLLDLMNKLLYKKITNKDIDNTGLENFDKIKNDINGIMKEKLKIMRNRNTNFPIGGQYRKQVKKRRHTKKYRKKTGSIQKTVKKNKKYLRNKKNKKNNKTRKK